MSRLSRNLLLGVAAVLAVAIAFVLWTCHRPPRITRLLPESDAILYADLQPVRLATHFDRSAPPRSPAFQAFVDATGIVPERDLNEVAFALTKRPNPAGPNGPVAYTEIFKGRFDRGRLTSYLARISVAQEHYAGLDVYSVASEDSGAAEPRLLRVTAIGPDLIAASNAPTAEQLHALIDRSRAGFLGTATPSLLADRFSEVPALSTAWGIGSLGLPLSESGHVALLGLALPLPADQPMVASVRYLGVLRLRLIALAPSSDLAMQQTGALTGLLGLFRSLAQTPGETNPQILAALDSIRVAQSGSRTVVTADIPTGLLKQMARHR